MSEKVVTKFLGILSRRSPNYGITVPWAKFVKSVEKRNRKL